MDVLNFISWIKRKDYRDTVPANAITVVGVPDNTRDDKFLSVVVPITAFGSIVPLATTTTPGTIIVGSGLTINSLGVLSATYSYTLPTASPSVLGGVKVGSGLSIDGSGVLSATYSYTLPTASPTVLGGIKIGTGLSINGSGVLSTIPTPTYDEVIEFNQLTPTSPGVIFTPNTPAVTNVLYVSTVDTSIWIWNGTSYQTVTVANNTEWNFLGTSIDAGSNKTFPISRDEAIHTLYADSYFYEVRAGRGGGNQISNTILGNGAGAVNTTGTFNSFIGYNSGSLNTIGESNAFFGYTSGEKNTSGINNTFIGDRTGQNNTAGSYNTFIGTRSGFNSSIGSNNTFIGDISGEYLSDGLTPLTLSNNSVFIGANTQALANNQTNQIVIGYNATGKGSNTVQLGNTSITRTYLQGDLTVSNATAVTTAAVTQTKHFPIVINGVTYKLLLAD